MSWLKKANNNGIEKRIKDKIRSSPFFIKLFQHFKASMKQLDELSFSFRQLENKFCEASEDEIIIDERLASSPDFLHEKFHFVAHEILHWLRRKFEKENYFGDPEEIESFNAAIAYDIFENKNTRMDMEKHLYHVFLPLIKVVIKDDNKAQEFLKHRIQDAHKLLKRMLLCNYSS